jgi:hypothetical protein
MNQELAELIARLAAPLYAAMLAPLVATGKEIPATTLSQLRHHAIQQARALWLDALDFPD